MRIQGENLHITGGMTGTTGKDEYNRTLASRSNLSGAKRKIAKPVLQALDELTRNKNHQIAT